MPRVSADYLLARREQILAAAATRFAREGFHRTSMQDVIDEAGLSPGAVYRYFASKDEIIVAISLDAMGMVEAAARDALAADHPLPRLVGELVQALMLQTQADDRMRLAVQAWGEALRNPTLAEAMQRGLVGVRAALRDRIGAGRDRGEMAADMDPAAAANVVLAMVQGFILQHCWDPGLDSESYGRAAAMLVGQVHSTTQRSRPGS